MYIVVAVPKWRALSACSAAKFPSPTSTKHIHTFVYGGAYLCAIFLQIGASLWHFQTNNVIIGKLHNHQLTSSCLVTMIIANKKRKHHCRLDNIFILISIEWRCRSVLCWTSSLFDEISYKMCVCACTNIQWWIFSIYHVLLLRQPCLSRRYYYMIVVAVTAIVLLSSLYIALFVYGWMYVCMYVLYT